MFSDFDAALPEVAVQRALGDAQPFGDVVHAQASLTVQGLGGHRRGLGARRHAFRTATHSSTRPCRRQAGLRALPDHDPDTDYGNLNALARQRVNLNRITPHCDDVLRLVGSLKLGLVPALGVIRTRQVDYRPTPLAQAIAEIGRIDKTIHTLNFIDDEDRRRSTLQQLNLGEGRHSLARDVFHGKRGELYQRYREGQEDQSG